MKTAPPPEKTDQFYQERYDILKKKFKVLRGEYLKAIGTLDETTSELRTLMNRRKALKDKLGAFMKSQNFRDTKT